MELPSFQINKSSKIWLEFLKLKFDHDFEFDSKQAICNLTIPTSAGGNKYTFCEQKIANYPDTTLFYDDKFSMVAHTVSIDDKVILLYYVEFNPGQEISIYEASNEGTAMENFICSKYKLPAFSLYNAANLDIPLAKQHIHMDELEAQSANDYLKFQVVSINNKQRLLFKPNPSEFEQHVKPIVMLLETTYKGKYKVVTSLSEAVEIINYKIQSFVSK